MLPLVSCLCPTYGRFPNYGRLLEECVQSFLLQDYPRKELIILNDCPSQKLSCNSPGVSIFNASVRSPSLGQKYNGIVRLSRGEVLLPWEDDDISLPHRISQAVENLWNQGSYFNPQRTWYMQEGILYHDHTHGVCHNASAFTREAFDRVGGYPEVSGNQDLLMDQRLKALNDTVPSLPNDPSSWSYIYRWGSSNFHLSAHPDSKLEYDSAYQNYGTRKMTPGEFTILAKWSQDYHSLCAISRS